MSKEFFTESFMTITPEVEVVLTVTFRDCLTSLELTNCTLPSS